MSWRTSSNSDVADPGFQRKGGGGTATDQAEDDWKLEADEAARIAVDMPDAADRARGHRLSLLLVLTRPAQFADVDAAVDFIHACHTNAASEAATLALAAPAAGVSPHELLLQAGEGFPRTWGDKVYNQFHIHERRDIEALKQTFEARRADALASAASIAPDVWDRGLPLTPAEARTLTEWELAHDVLSGERLRKPASEVTNAYTQAMFRWLQAGSHYGLVRDYEATIISDRVKLLKGELIGTAALYQYWYDEFIRIRRRLEDYRRTDVKPTVREATLEMSIEGAGGWYMEPLDGRDAWLAEIAKVDRRIAGTGFNDCAQRAFIWAFERRYLEHAGVEAWNAFKAGGWKLLATALAVIGAQWIPGVNVALDVALTIEFGLDALATLVELKDAFTAAGTAKSVLDMEHAAVQLAQALVGTGAKILLWAVGWGTGKLAGRAMKYLKGQKFIDRHGGSSAARKALAEAGGDVEAAERAMIAEQQRTAAAKPVASPPSGGGRPAPAQPTTLVDPPPAKLPESPAKLPESPAKLPESPVKLPESPVKLPESPVKLPESPVKLPESPVKLPKSPVKPPEPLAKLPESPVKLPESPVKLPEPPANLPKPTRPRQAPRARAVSKRGLAEVERELKRRGVSGDVLRSFSGGKRATAALAQRVERLLDHFTPADLKKLGEFLSENERALSDEAVDVLVNDLSQVDMAETIRALETRQTLEATTRGAHRLSDDPALADVTTVGPGGNPRTGAPSPSRTLRASLEEKLGELPPRGYHAHHIIPDKQFGEALNWMRNRLRAARVAINDAENGVFLAGSKSTANPELTRLHNSYIHAGATKEYAYTLTRRLADKQGAAFVQEVEAIGEEMRTGRFEIDKIPYGFKTKWQPGMTAPVERGFEPGWIEE